MPTRPATAGEEEAWRLLLHPALYPHAVKLAHREEWRRSIEESHPAGPGRDALLAKFEREVSVIRAALGPALAARVEAAAAGGGPEGVRQAWFG